jgi:TfoX/Sxy family transcriptional regulator of competence genes
MAYDHTLAERIRERLAGRTGVTEKAMFGGLAFLSGGNMTVGVHGDDLIVRVHPDATQDALTRPGARPFALTGREMRGWLLVAGEQLDDPVLDGWLAQASAFVATLPPK